MNAVRQLAGVAAFPYGGYPQAERARIFLGQEDIIKELQLDPQQVSCKPPVQRRDQIEIYSNCSLLDSAFSEKNTARSWQ